jgi:hypothetical protein
MIHCDAKTISTSLVPIPNAIDPNAPPRPNLLSQDKKLRETTEAFGKLHDMLAKQQDTIAELQSKYNRMQQSVDQILNFLRKGR